MKREKLARMATLLSILIAVSIAGAVVSTNLSNSVSATLSVSASPSWSCWLEFDEGSGSTAYDNSSYNNDAAIYGALRNLVSGSNYALEFDGVDDYAEIPDSASLDLSDEITVMGWLHADSFSQPATIAGKWKDIGGSDLRSYLLSAGNDGTPRFYISTTGVDYHKAQGSALSAGQWYRLAGTFDGNDIKLYLNGVLVATTPQTGSLFQNDEPLMIGATDGYGTTRRFTDGLVDDVRIFNIALNSQEINADFLRSCRKYGVC